MRAVLKALDNGPWKTRIAEPTAEGLRALARRRGGAARGHQQPDPAVIGGGQGSLQAARRDRRALLRPQPRSRRHAPDLASGPRERAQAMEVLLYVAGHNLSLLMRQLIERRHPARGRGGRIWRYFRAARRPLGAMLVALGGLAKRPDGFHAAAFLISE